MKLIKSTLQDEKLRALISELERKLTAKEHIDTEVIELSQRVDKRIASTMRSKLDKNR
ncbi:MAG: hypothetical protein PWR27_160 [Petroclostridium sp.]|jgi:hypothetical protein|uniref:hypothetical protein n=1 Tax=Petroclostridium xylanilyticum TaxID=1792311 RepID=UPI0012FF6826|nr:hypothetical protein [Petroclostridium xylanilyticum]MBZ4647001.1 hypothetical protein [Clostridia bacterium]MDK2809451.1 hypothetical protein [Petroclostridium sp.]